MKYLLLFFGFAAISCFGQESVTAPASDGQSDQLKLASISQRIRAGDNNALFEAAKLPAEISIPYISRWAIGGPGAGPLSNQIVSVALRQVQGYADYLKEDMSVNTAQGSVPVDDFEILEVIGTPEAAAIAAPYLFDFKTNRPQEGDLAGDSNVGEALYTLDRMKLVGAPPPQPDEMSNAAYLVEWQKWAISKGYVPNGWASKIGAPKWMLQLDVAEGLTHTPVAAVTANPPRIISSAATALPSPPVPTDTASPSARPSLIGTAVAGCTYYLLTAVAFVLVIVGGILVWKKRP
jgi:hypothetical protein